MKRYRDWKLTSKLTIPVGAALLVVAIGASTVIYQQRMRHVREQAGKMAHALTLQIAEDRTYYTANVVGKLKKDGVAITAADSGFRDQPGAIPLPATFVKEVTEAINKKGYYKADLISGWPINKAKAPRTPFEREAFEAVARDPKTPRESMVDEGGQARLLYVSADVAGAQACVSCHNAHPDSPKKDYKLGDVMGALVVEIPVAAEIAAARAEAGMMIGGIALVLLLVLATLFAIARRFIQQPVGAITPIFQQMAQGSGDLTVRLRVTGEDEVGQLSRWFNTFMDKLQAIMRQVKGSAEQVSSASEQLSAGAGQLSSGAQEQAASLEETAASLEEITGTVKQNADNAKRASQLAMGSRDVAEKGGGVVAEAIRSMKEINQSSKRIADIITTIDEIAFQTNLLALNAAVEAARAGEQGRGFAVVASEVRNLAQRSATAAKEIKGLIQDSVAKVEAGSELVNRSGETLTEIVGSVKRVTDIIAEIAAASQEQTTGIDQVNQAVAQMDQVTQANTAQTEELSSTAQALAQQAGELQTLVGRFKLGGHAGGARSAEAIGSGAPRPVTRGRRAVDGGRGPVRRTDEVLMSVSPAGGNGKGQHKDDGFEEF